MSEKIKLAEALSQRKDLQKRIEQLKDRIKASVKVQEGDAPLEDPKELAEEMDRCLKRLEWLIYHINITNTQTQVEGKSLTELMAKKEVLPKCIEAKREIVNHASELFDRYSRNEIKYVITIDIKASRKELDNYSQELRELDMKIQSANYSTDLL